MPNIASRRRASCLPVPPGFDDDRGRGAARNALHRVANLFERGRASAGETCSSMAAPAGSARPRSGSARLFGLKIIVTAGSAEKCAAATALGADHAIDYKARISSRR
jgi:NADPH2:quinone reductase